MELHMSNIQLTNNFKTGGFVKYEGIIFEIVAVLKTDQLLLASIGAPVLMSECIHVPKNKLSFYTSNHLVKRVKQLNNNLYKWNK